MLNIKETLQNSFKVWYKLNDFEKNSLTESASVAKYKKGEIIYSGDDACMGLIIINKGIARAYLENDTGKQITLYKLLKNDICLFSAGCLMKDINFDISLECEEDVELILIPTEKYNKILESSPVISNYASNILSSRFSDTIWILEQFVFHSLDKRLANYLLEQNFEDGILITTHERIANELGSAREVISRMLKYFEQEKIIELKRNKIILLNIDKLGNIIK